MLPDPRTYPAPEAACASARELHALAEASLGAETGAASDAVEADLAARVRALVDGADGASLADALATSPSAAVYRHLWRAIVRDVERPADAGVGTVLFALPIVIVAAAEGDAEGRIDAVVPRPAELEAILAEHGALGGNRQFALAGALCAADAIDVGALPGLMRASRLPAEGGPLPPLDVAPRPIVAAPRSEQVHLRFLVGSALASSVSAVAAGTGTGNWGIPFTQALSRALARPGVEIAALPRAPQSLPAAVAAGRSTQREASAALFVSNAIRRLRAAVGEPVAVLSAHRVPGAATGGELRLSISSPLDPREAEGFRCPLHPLDRVADVATMLADLLRECRVADVRWLAGVHGDRDPATGLTLLFKPDTVPPGAELPVH